MSRPAKYPRELRERAVRMVLEHRDEYDSEWAAMTSIAAKLGVGTTETLRKWVRQAEVDDGVKPGITTAEQQRIKELEREVRELRRANEMAGGFNGSLQRPRWNFSDGVMYWTVLRGRPLSSAAMSSSCSWL